MIDDKVSERLLDFIRESFLDDDVKSELEEGTPLLDWGILNSMNIAILLNFIRSDLGYRVSPADIRSQNFRSVKDIASMILDMAAATSRP